MTAVQEEVVQKRDVYPSLEESPEFREAVARCESAEDDLVMVRRGTQLWKVRSYSKWYNRKFFLDGEDGILTYEPTHKGGCHKGPEYIRVDDILDVRKGWKTDTFNKFGSKVVGEQRKKKLKLLRKGPGRGGAAATSSADSSVTSSPASSAPSSKNGSPVNGGVKPVVDEACCFSVVYGSNRASLDLIAATPQLASLWVRALRHLVTVMRGMHQEERFNRWLAEQFTIADKDRSGSLVFDECLQLLKQLNVKMSRAEAHKLFTLANTDQRELDGKPALDSKEFVAFFQMLMKRPEVEALYHRYARSAREMTAEELRHFLVKEQHMKEVTIDDAMSLIDAFEQSELKKAGRISINGFTNILLSEQMEIMEASHRNVYQDMTQPLASYFIACSHNTYLLGRQVYADSTVEGYIEALKRGCRCLELDCWDGPDGEPVVTHGYALTSKILFRDVLVDAIIPNAFVLSEYPLILSLENHCTSEQQKRLAFHLTDVFGDMLYTEVATPDMKELPSPHDLRHKVIIKCRKAVPVNSPESESDSEEDSECPGDAGSNPSSPETLYPSINKINKVVKKTPKEDDCKVLRVTDQNLSDLVNICQSVKFHGFYPPGECYEMVSLAESKALQIAETQGAELVRFNTRRLTRIYPAGTRARSSNFKPCPVWNAGCQLVALNYQGNKKPVFFNEAKFRPNGGCGYILKPDFLCEPNYKLNSYDPMSTNMEKFTGLEERVRVLNIRVISGQHLPKPDQEIEGEVVDPYVKVKIVGHPLDKQKNQTIVVYDNGFNPMWDCMFTFIVRFPELAFVYFIVRDENTRGQDRILGCYALPFTSIGRGFRHVPLMDMRRKSLAPASLFIHTEFVR